jgi:hypothetical protein
VDYILEISRIKIKKKKYHTVETNLKYNRIIENTEAKLTSLHILIANYKLGIPFSQPVYSSFPYLSSKEIKFISVLIQLYVLSSLFKHSCQFNLDNIFL